MVIQSDPRYLGQLFRFAETDIPLAANVPNMLVDTDPSRITMIISINSGPAISVGLTANVLPLQGMQYPTGIAPLKLVFSELGSILGMQWFAVTTAPGNVHVLTVSYFPSYAGV